MGTAEALRSAATGMPPAPPPGSITAREARNPYDLLAHQLDARVDEFSKILGGRAHAEAFIRVVRNAVLATPGLLDCDRGTLLLAAMRAAQDGLLPDGREAVLNVYNTKTKDGDRWVWVKKAQYLPMVAGLIKLIWESGEVTYLDAAVWYERDFFKFHRGDNASIEHEPYGGEDDPGRIMGAYVVVKLKGGETKREVMYRRDIERVRAVSKTNDEEGRAKPDSAWGMWYDQQAIKSVIKRVQKQLPRTDRLARAIASDNEEMHPQMAAQASMGDLAALSSGSPPPALEHRPGQVLDQGAVVADASEKVPRGSAAAKNRRAGTKREPGGQTDAIRAQGGGPAIDPADRPDTGSAPGAVVDRPGPGSAQEHAGNGTGGAGGPSYAQLANRLNRVETRELADLILDEGRTARLPPEQQRDLQRLVDAAFPEW